MLTNEKEIYTILLIAAGILVSFIVYFFVTLMKHHRKNIQLYKDKLNSEITVLENERKRMAADLHDDLGPVLAAVKLYASNLQPHSENDKTVINKISVNINEALEHIHTTAYNLLPNVLIRMGLIEAIKDLVKNIQQSGAIEVQLINHIEAIQLPENVNIHIYRVIKEIIGNTIKHAKAKRFSIELFASAKLLTIVTQDDGQGFDADTIFYKKTNGLGLKNILSRVEVIKGEIFVTSSPEKGVNYKIEIPIN